jgi:hypothetical protein
LRFSSCGWIPKAETFDKDNYHNIRVTATSKANQASYKVVGIGGRRKELIKMKEEESLWVQSQRASSSVLIGLDREARQDLDRARVPSVKRGDLWYDGALFHGQRADAHLEIGHQAGGKILELKRIIYT